MKKANVYHTSASEQLNLNAICQLGTVGKKKRSAPASADIFPVGFLLSLIFGFPISKDI